MVKLSKLSSFAAVFFKKAQLINVVSDSVDPSNQITQEDIDKLMQNSNYVVNASNVIKEWFSGKISPRTNNLNLLEKKRFADDMYDSAINLKSDITQFTAGQESNSSNNTISNIEPNLRSLSNNYNELKPDSNWESRYGNENEGRALKQIEKSISFFDDFLTKQKNVEANSGTEPPLPIQ